MNSLAETFDIGRGAMTRTTAGLACVALAMCTGCTTSADLDKVRTDLQKDMQEFRGKYDRSLAEIDAKRKAGEEMQVRLSKEVEAQGKAIAGLASTTKELQIQRAATGDTTLLKDTILRSLKAEQADLEQRLKKMTEYIKDLEQSGPASKPAQSEASTAGRRGEKPSPEGQSNANAPDEPRPAK